MLEKMLTVSIKDRAQPIHWHDFLEINFVLAGEMEVAINNRMIVVKEGEMIVLNRDDVHSINSDSQNLLYVQLHLDLERYNQYIPDIWTVLFRCSPGNNDAVSQNLKAEIKSQICRIVDLMESQEHNVDAEKKIIYYCIDILSTLKMAFVATNSSKEKNLTEEQSDRLWKVIDYMYDNHSRKLTLNEVAQQVYISDDYLSRLLKKQIGMGFEEFLSFIRAELSLRLLLNTDMGVTNIAYECGFSAPKYYNTAFLKSYRCTPTEYRNNKKKNFMLEKHKEAAKVIFDETVKQEHAFKLLKKYEMLVEGNEIAHKKLNIDVSDIFDGQLIKNNIKAAGIWNHTILTALAEIHTPCTQPDENVYVWKEQNAIKLLLINPGQTEKTEYNIRIEGLEKDKTYIYCREKTPDIPASLNKLIRQGKIYKLDRDIIQNIYNRDFEYGEVVQEEQIFMDVELSLGQIAKIVIQNVVQ